jgi:ligand-binding sensor domain-containing protein
LPGLDEHAFIHYFYGLMHPLGTGTRSCVLFAILIAVLPAALFGQDLYFEKREFPALTISTVADITEDDRGYLWIATPGGLVRYHGIGAELINRQSHPDLPADDILSVEYINDRQQIWIGTVAGLVEYDLKSEKMSFPSIRSAARKSVGYEMIDITDMGDGSLFAVSRSEVFRSVRGGMLESVAVESQRSEAMEFFQVGVGEDGTAWLAASDGLKRWNIEKEVFEHVLNTGQTRCMTFLDGEVWLGTALAQVIRFDPDQGVVHRYAAMGDSASIIVSPDNQIWVGSASGGLSIINPETHEIQTQEIDPEHPYKLSSRRIQTLMRGGSGHIWIGTADAGLLSVDLRKQNHLTFIQRSGPQSIPAGPIHVVFEDSLGYIWAGSYIGGLARIDPVFNDIRQYTHRAGDFFSISGDHISTMIEDGSGRIWIGTDQGPALYISEIDGFEPPGIMMEGWPDFQGRHVLAMAESPNGAIWMSLRSGDFYKLDPMERDFVRFRFTPASVPSVMVVDSFGTLWAGSRRNLRIFNVEGSLVKTWLPVGTDSGGIPDGGVSALLWDSRDRLWLGSPTGLAMLRNPEEGFQSLMILNRSIINVSDILEDSEGNLWIAEGRKIHILDAEGQHITTMDGESGLTPSGPITGLTLGRSGKVYAAANGELWSFEAFLAPIPVNTPQVRLTELRVFNEIRANGRTLAEDNLIILNSNENMFSIGFEALDYRYQEEVRYEYRLEGFHEDWIESGNMDSVTYVKLPPGQYRFVVRSSTEQGLYDESEAVLNIRVEPTFWRTPFAIAIYAAVLAVTVTIIVKLREGNLLKNQVRQLEEARKKSSGGQSKA